MIWYFLAGWISGAVAVIMILERWAKARGIIVRADENDEKKDGGENGTT